MRRGVRSATAMAGETTSAVGLMSAAAASAAPAVPARPYAAAIAATSRIGA